MDNKVCYRIKNLRDTLQLSLVAFGQQVGYSDGMISLIERGKKQPEEKLIRLICSAFNVDETWLRSGKGEMFVPKAEPQLSRDEIITDFIQTILGELSEANRRIVLDAIENLPQKNFFKKNNR